MSKTINSNNKENGFERLQNFAEAFLWREEKNQQRNDLGKNNKLGTTT